ncbi:MAG: fibronectin type III domain-containing protein [Candidatus Rickettsia vulgarisii]
MLKAKSTITLTFDVNFSQTTSNPELPTNFKLNDEPILIAEDLNPPTKVESAELASSTPKAINLKWPESIDKETGVNYYLVQYRSKDGKQLTQETSTNNISLQGLDSNTEYTFKISAVDYSGNHSDWSKEFSFSTSEPLKGPAPWQSGLWIKCAPFIDATSWPTPPADEWSKATGIKYYFLGFATGAEINGKYKACWGGNATITDG